MNSKIRAVSIRVFSLVIGALSILVPGHYFRDGSSAVRLPASSGSCEASMEQTLTQTDFTAQEVLKVLQASATANALIKSINPLPDFKDTEDLTPQQLASLKSFSEGPGSSFLADFIPPGALDPDRAVILVHKGNPLYATLVFSAHELKHAADHTSQWAQSIDSLWTQMKKNNGVVDQGDRADANRKAALFNLFTYMSEYRAFSADSQVRRELTQAYPCFAPLWTSYVLSHPTMRDLDPAENPKDRLLVLEEYVHPEDYEDLKKDLDGFSHSPEISAAVDESAVSLKDLRDALNGILSP
jgi:hypothetical protein